MSPEPDPLLVKAALDLVLARLEVHSGLFVLGISGSQGSGKSTLARTLHAHLLGHGVSAANLSLDDLYLTRTEREELAARVHPLLRTRGVPGTHDVSLGINLFAALERGEQVALPRFDKAQDDREPQASRPLVPRGCRVLIFEGWCVGAPPQPDGRLGQPVNALEREEDPDAIWRQYANDHLGHEYRQLFSSIDALIFLAAPDFSVVRAWRLQQERDIAGQGAAVMDETEIVRFIQFYHRITEWMLEAVPEIADLTARLDRDRRVTSIA